MERTAFLMVVTKGQSRTHTHSLTCIRSFRQELTCSKWLQSLLSLHYSRVILPVHLLLRFNRLVSILVFHRVCHRLYYYIYIFILYIILLYVFIYINVFSIIFHSLITHINIVKYNIVLGQYICPVKRSPVTG